jgi:hypothetical protein
MLRHLKQEQRGLSASRNAALDAATTHIVAFTDERLGVGTPGAAGEDLDFVNTVGSGRCFRSSGTDERAHGARERNAPFRSGRDPKG